MSLPREFLYELHKNFTGDIRTDAASRILYSTDASIYQIEPLGVVIPRTQEELHAAVELAVRYRIPILPRGAGTSLAGQAVGAALILDCSRWLDRIVEINPEERYAIVEPGTVLADVNRAAAKHGLMYGPDPASAERATMGGIIANNATGAHSIVYGMSADHLLSAEVILGDGTLETWDEDAESKITQTAKQIRGNFADAIKNGWTQTWRNSAGYRLNYLLPWSPSVPPHWVGDTYPANLAPDTWNLAHVLAGSEGTLAVIRRMKVNLVPKPEHTILAVLSYESVAEACDDVPRILTHHPSAVELIPRTILRAARSSPAYSNQMTWIASDPAALLVVEFSGDEVHGGRVASGFREHIETTGLQAIFAESKEAQAQVWNVRRVGLGLMDSTPGSKHPVAFIEDCAIPVERLGDFVREVEKILAEHGAEGGIYAHASAGCLHIRPILDLHASLGVKHLRSISEAVFVLTVSLGGAMSSEHGDGLARSEYMARTYGSEIMDAMRMLKDAADPHHLLNPGKILDAPKLDENLRYGTDYQTHAWKPSLSFHREGSFELAVEMCNGQGLCRKTSGVMCPSYQGTRDEMHSTRGRANLLRALISDDAVRNTSYDVLRKDRHTEDTFQALDLCLACKGCKAECPSGVDMAKLKYEFENEYYKSHRRPLRDFLFGYFHVVAGLLSPIAPLANALMNFPVTRKLIAKSLGLAVERPLPRIVGRGLVSIRGDDHAATRPPVVIFLPDVFSRYIEPQAEQAALEVLTACGYEVHVLPIVGAGASFLSKGMIEAARRHARKTLEMLNQADPTREAVIVGLEPPEIYLLKNDYIDLLPDRAEEIRQLEGRVWSIDEFLVRSKEFREIVTLSPSTSFRVNSAKGLNVAGDGDSSLPRSRYSAFGGTRPAVAQNDMKLFFHPHCHQRAEGLAMDGIPSGANSSVEVLRQCGYDVELSDAGCCGLAGTFGYEAEHYDLSMKIAGLKLLPKIRELTPSRPPPSLRDTSPKYDKEILDANKNINVGFGGGRVGVVSSGAACRMQIRHGAGLETKHPIEWVRDALKR